jgi:hypothetical protein
MYSDNKGACGIRQDMAFAFNDNYPNAIGSIISAHS